MKVIQGPEGLIELAGSELGTSEWMIIDQERVDRFAEATDDSQWIHVDPERAAAGPYGGTLAHGYLTLSLIPSHLRNIFRIEGFSRAVNYGLNKVRFITPVVTGRRVRARAWIDTVTPLDGAIQVNYRLEVEVEGSERPACVADTIVRYFHG